MFQDSIVLHAVSKEQKCDPSRACHLVRWPENFPKTGSTKWKELLKFAVGTITTYEKENFLWSSGFLAMHALYGYESCKGEVEWVTGGKNYSAVFSIYFYLERFF